MAALALVMACSAPAPAPQVAPDGATVFAANCAVCHTLPILSSMWEQNRGRAPGFVVDALSHGNMRRMGSSLDGPSRRAVAEFFTGVAFDSDASARDFAISPACAADRLRFDWDDDAYPSWGRTVRNLRSTPSGEGGTRDEASRLAVSWVVAFPESSQLRSEPTAAGGALFVGSHNGSVYSLDQETGCTRWHFKAATEVRTAVTVTVDERRAGARAYFADRAANVYAVDAETGKLLWSRSVDPHPSAAITGSITAHAGRLFVPVSSNEDINALDPAMPCCTHHGAVVALNAVDGAPLWRTPTVEEAPVITGYSKVGTPIWGPSGASVWNTPTVSERHGLLFVGAGNNHSHPATRMSDSVLAMRLATGEVVWRYQAQSGDAWNASCIYGSGMGCPEPVGPDTDFGATTLLLELDGEEVLVAGQKSGVLHALDAATGRLRWKREVSRGGAEAGIRYGMASQGGAVFVPSTHQATGAGPAARPQPGVVAVSVADGQLLWAATGPALCAAREGCDGAVTAPPLATDEVVFAAALDGVVYALDRRSGERVWRFDTNRSFTTLLGRTTRGGGIAGTAGPMLANGRLFVSSGYGQAQRPGNALIAFAPRPGGPAEAASSSSPFDELVKID
jgi:polyvinyl alcohol dehydrogenase (cytochrome)